MLCHEVTMAIYRAALAGQGTAVCPEWAHIAV